MPRSASVCSGSGAEAGVPAASLLMVGEAGCIWAAGPAFAESRKACHGFSAVAAWSAIWSSGKVHSRSVRKRWSSVAVRSKSVRKRAHTSSRFGAGALGAASRTGEAEAEEA